MVTESDPQARTWAMVCHLAALAGLAGVGFGHILGPLVVWLIKKNDSPFIDYHGKEAINFQISMTIYAIIAGILIIAVVGIFLLPLVILLNLIFLVVAAIRANNGEVYRYPLTLRFIK